MLWGRFPITRKDLTMENGFFKMSPQLHRVHPAGGLFQRYGASDADRDPDPHRPQLQQNLQRNLFRIHVPKGDTP